MNIKQTQFQAVNFFIIFSALFCTVVTALGVGILMGDISINPEWASLTQFFYVFFTLYAFMIAWLLINFKIAIMFPALQKTEEQIQEEEEYYNRKRW